jgi:hypothetical protein
MQDRRHGDTITMTRPRDGTWGERTRIGRNGRYATLAVDSTGEAVAAWQTATNVYASYRNSSQPWLQATRLGTKATPLMSAAIGEDDTGVVTWYRHAGPGEKNVLLKATVRAS